MQQTAEKIRSAVFGITGKADFYPFNPHVSVAQDLKKQEIKNTIACPQVASLPEFFFTQEDLIVGTRQMTQARIEKVASRLGSSTSVGVGDLVHSSAPALNSL